MPKQQKPVTYEGVLKMLRLLARRQKETDRHIKETDRHIKETNRQIKRTSKEVGALGSRIGQVIEGMVKGKIVAKFQAFGYEITQCYRNKFFEYKELGIRGEIDFFLENGEIAILIEVKTTLETKDVRDHIERMKKFRRYVDVTSGDTRRFIGAVAGAVVTDEAEKFAQENGMYVIVQSGKAVEIVTPPEGFVPKEW